MAKKAKLSLVEKIARAESNILMCLYPKYLHEGAERWQPELDTSLANLEQLYQERDRAAFIKSVEFDHSMLDGLTNAQQINLVEHEALGLHAVLIQGRRLNQAAWKLEVYAGQLNLRLDLLNEELYLARWTEHMMSRTPLVPATVNNDRKYLGPDKLNGRAHDRDRQSRKTNQRNKSAAAKSAKDKPWQGQHIGPRGSHGNQPKPKAA